jgi:alginate O-acetyltransferase complex protein AlgI
MLFQTLEFAVFYVFVAVSWFNLPLRSRPWLLLFASYYFYMAWDLRFGALILASTLIDYVCGRRIEAEPRDEARRGWLVASLVTNLGILAFFKYQGFFAEMVEDVAAALSLQAHIPVLEVVLPVGISFFTFQSMSHTIDVYRRVIPAEKSLLNFAVYVSFFPQLVAGPIVRARDFLPQLRHTHRFDAGELSQGLHRILIGLLKKIVVADNLAALVDAVFAAPGEFSSTTIWLAAVAYSVQIYCDFSGYSDMAIGLARILGFHFPENFNFPYLSRSASEFWRRWHISLSSWLRDYLYISLGGNRRGGWMTLRNLMLTMLLGGLWHGASYGFLLWGFGHGLLLVIYRWLEPYGDRIRRLPGQPALAIVFMNVAVCALWVPFRAPTLADAGTMLNRMFLDWSLPQGSAVLANVDLPLTYTLLGVIFVLHLIHALGTARWSLPAQSLPLRSLSWGLMIFLIFQFQHEGQVPFVYFQF